MASPPDSPRVHARGLALLCCLIAALMGGCASGPSPPQAKRLLDVARAEIKRSEYESAYTMLKRIRIRYPKSEQADAAYPLACETFQRMWYERRYSSPDAEWADREQRFLFDWLADHFGDTYPYAELKMLLAGLPMTVFHDFQRFAASDPRTSGWTFIAFEDNGITQVVTAEPRGEAPAPADLASSPAQRSAPAPLPPVSSPPPGFMPRTGPMPTLIDFDIEGGSESGTGDMTWGPGLALNISTSGGPSTAPCPIVLDRPIFVRDGRTLTILPGCIIRGQPRSGPVVQGSYEGSPGALVITRTGRLDAVGRANAPIVFTTAAIDNNQDAIPDDTHPADRYLSRWNPDASPPDVFLDDDPMGAPLAPLNARGSSNASLWGGVVLLGQAPTNLANNAGDWGEAVIEGLTAPGSSTDDATYGGLDPHHSSGRFAFASIRHAGDEIGADNELNCLSLGGVGDGTLISHIECYASHDDGFEWFGGTVHGDHLVVTLAGDDALDVDQGYTGTNQFIFVLMPHFNEDDGDPFGAVSGDHAGEFDGDDRGNASMRIDGIDGNRDDLCWPIPSSQFYNMTVLGPAPRSGAQPEVAPVASPKLRSNGLLFRNGFAGKVLNAMVLNGGVGHGLRVASEPGDSGCPNSDTTKHVAAGLVAVVSSTFDNVAPIPGYTDTSVSAGTADVGDALIRGDEFAARLSPYAWRSTSNRVNSASFAGLESDMVWFDPHGNPRGKLDSTLLPRPIDPQPRLGTSGALDGVVPMGPGLDASASFRGAFRRGAPKWTAGWTVLSNAGLMADD